MYIRKEAFHPNQSRPGPAQYSWLLTALCSVLVDSSEIHKYSPSETLDK